MWRLLLPLALAAAQGAQYGDYGAVKMPAYGDYDVPREAASDDYRRPAASLDYKYEDGNKGNTDKTLNKEYRNGDSWQKPSRKQSKRLRNDEDYPESADGASRDSERKYRAGNDRPPGDERMRAGHKRHAPGEEDEFSIEKYIQGINENNLEADATYASRRPSDRIIRRKTRDRENEEIGPSAPAYKSQEVDEEAALAPPPLGRAPLPAPKDEVMSDFREDLRSGEAGEEADERARPRPNSLALLPVEKRVRPVSGEMGPRRRPAGPYPPEGEEAGPPRLRPAQRARLEPGAAEYDNEYYDVKRLRNMQRRPGFNRRPETSAEENENLAPGIPFAEMEYLDGKQGGRRAFDPAGPGYGLMSGTGPGRRPMPTRRPAARRPATRRTATPRRPTIPRQTTRGTTTSTTTTTSSTITTVTTSAAPTLTPSHNGSKVLSMAEKSRLSIMKKASRKERIGGPSTTKPPVLLQVTKVMPTVVMVASSTTGDPWMRAREVSGDSPETLAKVRQLMRAKLVANAKDIRDLTEDWDQEVCDYVDVKLLENAAPAPGPAQRPAPFVLPLMLCALAKPL